MNFLPENNFPPTHDGVEPLDVPYLSQRVKKYPQLRLMGNKYRLLPWIGETLNELHFDSALDGFSGSGCVSYLMKCMGKSVTSNDFLNFSSHITNALIANPDVTISESDLCFLLTENDEREDFILNKFKGIFFSDDDNKFLDNTWANLINLDNIYKKSLVISALCRSCIKKQPRGVFTTITANNDKYRDGRRDLKITLKEHFLESINLLNSLVIDNKKNNESYCKDIFEFQDLNFDLVYLDPPYVPRSDDNCYIKRYHFLEGLSCYWHGMEIMENSVVKKIKKRYTPFSYRRSSLQAFDDLFNKFKDSIILLSYSSNGYPDKDVIISMLKKIKGADNVDVRIEPHTYHFGTHKNVSKERKKIKEYLFIGT